MSAELVSTTINGDVVEFACPPEESLMTALRDRVGLTGVKEGCGTGDCGACSVTLDGELVATLPVASNLPWVAALAGGLPVAAGVFVVSKVFEKQFDVLSSAVYRLEGSWDDPEVSFDRIWDDGSGRLVPGEAVSDPQQPGAVPGISGIDFAPDPQAVQP